MVLPKKNLKRKILATCLLSMFALNAYASKCQSINYQSGNIIHVSSSQNLGTRIELPSNLIKPPVITNALLWDIGGEVGTKQIVVAPNSNNKLGNKAMVFAFTETGKVYDIMVTRVAQKAHQACVVVNERPNFFFAPTPKAKPKPVVAPAKKESINTLTPNPVLETQYPQMFTQYQWDKQSETYPQNLIADVYDDGRTTFIRLADRHQGKLLVETKISGKNTLIPVSNNTDHSIYSINGVYGQFNILLGNSSILVTR